MKSLRHYILIFLAALFLFSVFALPDSYAVHELFKHVDENSDGKITPREFKEDMKEQAFEKLDADEDKKIEKEEWVGFESVSDRERHINLFEKIDKDKDSRISFFEFSNYADKEANLEEAFMGIDKNRNNSLSPDELTVRPLFKMITIRF